MAMWPNIWISVLGLNFRISVNYDARYFERTFENKVSLEAGLYGMPAMQDDYGRLLSVRLFFQPIWSPLTWMNNCC